MRYTRHFFQIKNFRYNRRFFHISVKVPFQKFCSVHVFFPKKVNQDFSPRHDLNVDEYLSEWYSLKFYIFYEYKEEKNAEILWKNISTRGFFKELKVFLHYYLSFLLGNAGVERKFSIMNSIKQI